MNKLFSTAVEDGQDVVSSKPISSRKIFAIVSIVFGSLNLIPGVTFFLGLPITFYCIATFTVLSLKKDEANARLAGIGVLLAFAGWIILFSFIDNFGF